MKAKRGLRHQFRLVAGQDLEKEGQLGLFILHCLQRFFLSWVLVFSNYKWISGYFVLLDCWSIRQKSASLCLSISVPNLLSPVTARLFGIWVLVFFNLLILEFLVFFIFGGRRKGRPGLFISGPDLPSPARIWEIPRPFPLTGNSIKVRRKQRRTLWTR